jgi:hypothetical protein
MDEGEELHVVFHGHERVAVGSRLEAALAAQRLRSEAGVLIFGPQMAGRRTSTSAADRTPWPCAWPCRPRPPRGRGRPKLGVVAREITLLPRHWDWLASNRAGRRWPCASWSRPRAATAKAPTASAPRARRPIASPRRSAAICRGSKRPCGPCSRRRRGLRGADPGLAGGHRRQLRTFAAEAFGPDSRRTLPRRRPAPPCRRRRTWCLVAVGLGRPERA